MRSQLTLTYTVIPIRGSGRFARPFATDLDIGQVDGVFASTIRTREP